MKPEFLIIHHSATKRDRTTFKSVKKYHMSWAYQGRIINEELARKLISEGKKVKYPWEDIGYHHFITPQKVYHGRGEDKVGAHCRANGMNFKSLGICLTGNFEIEEPTPGQIEKLEKLLSELREKYNIPKENILGHREVKNARTLCPGKNLLPIVEAYRKKEEKQKDDIGELKRESEILHKIIKLLKEEKVI